MDWKQVMSSVEPFLESVSARLAGQIGAFDPEISVYAEYALTRQGKQLRPVLVALSGGATGKLEDSHVLAAVIIEMVHLATLVHDDVIDEAVLRRGRPTVPANWGNEVSVLLGDCFFAHALELAASFPTTEVCRAVSAATNRVCSGEILQTHRRRSFGGSQEDYFKVLSMKTGELFALSCELGCFLSGASADQRVVLRHFGLTLGTAYQVYDDCLDIFGNEVAAGKSLGTDLAKGKLTLPLLLLWERSEAGERRDLEALIRGWEAEAMPGLLLRLSGKEILPRCQEVIHQQLYKAAAAVQELPTSRGRAGLMGLTRVLARQADALADPIPLAL